MSAVSLWRAVCGSACSVDLRDEYNRPVVIDVDCENITFNCRCQWNAIECQAHTDPEPSRSNRPPYRIHCALHCLSERQWSWIIVFVRLSTKWLFVVACLSLSLCVCVCAGFFLWDAMILSRISLRKPPCSVRCVWQWNFKSHFPLAEPINF